MLGRQYEEEWLDEEWSGGDWHLAQLGEMHRVGILTWDSAFSGNIALSVVPDDGTIGLSAETVDFSEGEWAEFEVRLMKAPPERGATYTINAKPSNGWATTTHTVTVAPSVGM